MTKSTSFALGSHFDKFIANQLDSGRFNNASEVMRTALRLLEEHEQKVEALRAALIEGEESGISNRTIDQIVTEEKEKRRTESNVKV